MFVLLSRFKINIVLDSKDGESDNLTIRWISRRKEQPSRHKKQNHIHSLNLLFNFNSIRYTYTDPSFRRYNRALPQLCKMNRGYLWRGYPINQVIEQTRILRAKRRKYRSGKKKNNGWKDQTRLSFECLYSFLLSSYLCEKDEKDFFLFVILTAFTPPSSVKYRIALGSSIIRASWSGCPSNNPDFVVWL